MKILSFAAILLWTTSSALSADKLTINVSPNRAAEIVSGLSALSGYQKIIHNAAGADEAISIPYKLDVVRITIARDIRLLTDIVRDYQSAARSMKPDEAAKMADAQQPVDIVTFQADDLKIPENPIPPNVLAAISQVCPSCIGN